MMADQKSEGYGVLWRIMKPVNRYIYSAMGLSALGSTATIGMLLMLSLVLAVLLAGGEGLHFMGISWTVTGALTGVGIFGALSFFLTLLGFGISHLGAFYLEENLRTRLSKHLAQLPLGCVITTGTGALKKVFLEDVKNLHSFVADSTPTIGRGYTAPLITAVALLIIDWRLALIAVGILVVGMVVMSFAMRDSKAMQKHYEESREKVNAAVIEFIQAMAVVRTFDDGTSTFKRYHKALDFFREMYVKWAKKSSGPARIAMVLLAPLPTVLAVVAGGIIFMKAGTLSLPQLIAALFLSTGMVDAFMPIMWLNNFLRKSKSSANRIEEVLAVPAMPVPEKGRMPRETTIRFDNVSFRYENREEDTLAEVNFSVTPESTTALVGPSGAGKSTVAKLLPRFWDVTGGAITIGSIDIRHITSEELMSCFAVVFQDVYLFDESIIENIRMAKADATDEEVIEAAKAACCHEFIERLPNGYETGVGDIGGSLSGGERQRISIARAILKDAPIVILDEPTAALDTESEVAVQTAIDTLVKDKTIIVIAHRLSTIAGADHILVIDDGALVEQGTHASLLEMQGRYNDLWQAQLRSKKWHFSKQGEES
jgi:ATP-binding cassette, subfamily B, bacterial IrtA/YbtP